jgi:hypothetical protein
MERKAEETTMSTNRLALIIGALIFLALAAAALYRLLVGFPIVIGGMQVGQTSSFLAFVAFAALSIMFFRGASTSR